MIMKHSNYNRINKLIVAFVLMFATSSTAYAQFGGLINAAKKKAAEAVDKKVKEQTDPQKNLPKAKESEGDVELFYASGNRLGIWHPNTRTFVRFVKDNDEKWTTQSYIFQEDGRVMFTNERQAGEMNADGTLNSNNTKNIKLN
jgi:hypothetical protein